METNRLLGDCFFATREFARALTHHNKHLDIARSHGAAVEIQRAYINIGNTHLELADDDGRLILAFARSIDTKTPSIISCRESE
jgi:hypothetical protein